MKNTYTWDCVLVPIYITLTNVPRQRAVIHPNSLKCIMRPRENKTFITEISNAYLWFVKYN